MRYRIAAVRRAGPLAGAVLLGILALALHPHANGHAANSVVLQQLNRLAVRDRLVHGTLLLLIVALLVAAARYAVRRGLDRGGVVAGLIGFVAGGGALIGAGLIDGFMFPAIVARFAAAPLSIRDAAIATLTGYSVAVTTLTDFGVAAAALAIAAWSLDLAGGVRPARIAAVAGLCAAATSLAVLTTARPAFTTQALIAVFVAQGAWYVWLALLFSAEERL